MIYIIFKIKFFLPANDSLASTIINLSTKSYRYFNLISKISNS